MVKSKDKSGQVAVNKKAYHNYELVEKFEAGLSLLGTEVKSLRAGTAELEGSYARIEGQQCWLVGAKIAHYQQASDANNHEPTRKRKLLLHKQQIQKIKVKLQQRGFTFVPLRIYFNSRSLVKVELALAKGKRQYDKRHTIAERQQKRDVDRSIKKYKNG
ncbi:MAG: SsrA-binding protein SmpB [Planctomycetes bacterium]|nr:SsrA-binding protein SmpB [Planctomycetota bacterium]